MHPESEENRSFNLLRQFREAKKQRLCERTESDKSPQMKIAKMIRAGTLSHDYGTMGCLFTMSTAAQKGAVTKRRSTTVSWHQRAAMELLTADHFLRVNQPNGVFVTDTRLLMSLLQN